MQAELASLREQVAELRALLLRDPPRTNGGWH
jgi:hypothetical protein